MIANLTERDVCSSDYYERWDSDPSCIAEMRKTNKPKVVMYNDFGDKISWNTRTMEWSLKYPQNKKDVIRGRGIKALSQFTFTPIKELKEALC